MFGGGDENGTLLARWWSPKLALVRFFGIIYLVVLVVRTRECMFMITSNDM